MTAQIFQLEEHIQATPDSGSLVRRPVYSDELNQTSMVKPNKIIPESRTIELWDFSGQSDSRFVIDEIYKEKEIIREDLLISLTLLAEAITFLDEAQSLSQINDITGSDDAIQRLQSLLPELFCCRTLGDSFGMIVNAVDQALINRQGIPLSLDQIRLLKKILCQMREHPFMLVEPAIELITELEDVGFLVDPDGFEKIVDWIDG